MNIHKWWLGQKPSSAPAPLSGALVNPITSCRTSRSVVALLLHRPINELVSRIAARHHWNFLPVGTWTDAVDLILAQHVWVVIVEGDMGGTDTKERLFLLQREFHCLIVILTSKSLLTYWAACVNEPGFSILATPVIEADLVKAVEEGWSVWERWFGVAGCPP